MKLIPFLLFISLLLFNNARAAVTYEDINCSWNDSIIILTVTMDESWSEQRKELEAELVCRSMREYGDESEE